MISIGNDIVSLEPDRSNRFAQKAYYSKILSPGEEDYFYRQLANQLSFIRYVWLLWSIKEAAYKYLKRSNDGLLFNPQKITVEKIDLKDQLNPSLINKLPLENTGFENCGFIRGFAGMQDESVCIRSLITESFIFSVASDETFLDKIHWGIQKIGTSGHKVQSEAVREFAVRKLRDILPPQDFIIEKNEAGVPGIIYGSKLYPVSFTHHEAYIAYSFILQTAE